MEFDEFEELMTSKGIKTLAEIARKLETTPQAVSNWKARNQIPHHVVANLKQTIEINLESEFSGLQNKGFISPYSQFQSKIDNSNEKISPSDIFLVLAQQLKVIFTVSFLSVFLSFTYNQFILTPKYVSESTVLLQKSSNDNLSGIAGLASQFGVNVPQTAQTDLSSPSLFPELLGSRTFARKILDKSFYSEEHDKDLTLLAILTHGDDPPDAEKEVLISRAMGPLSKMIEFDQNLSSFSKLIVTTSNPVFSKNLAEQVLVELELLNKFFKSKNIDDKIFFINQRIISVEDELRTSEQDLKIFNEKNRQISTPNLRLEQERLSREVEIQKGIFLTLKQQFELARIEKSQDSPSLQVLDSPQLPLGPSNKNLKQSLFLSTIFGIGLGIILAFGRSYLNTENIDEKRKLRKAKQNLKKKMKEIFYDRKVSGALSLLLLLSLPFYIGHQSKNPVYFGMYSPQLMITIIIYIIFLVYFSFVFIFKKSK